MSALTRFLAGLLALCVLAGPAWAASPAIDASGVTSGSVNSNSIIVNVTTTSTNDGVVIAVMNQFDFAGATVSSVTGCSLTFRQLAQVGLPTNHVNLEIWYAPSTATQAACPVTVNLSAVQDGISVSTFGVSGLSDIANPLDTNAGAKACTTGAGVPPTRPVLTTSQPNDLLIGFGFYSYNGTPSAWTAPGGTLLYDYGFTGTSDNNNRSGAGFLSVSATQAGTSAPITTAETGEPVVECAMAFTGGGASPRRHRSTLSTMGAGQ